MLMEYSSKVSGYSMHDLQYVDIRPLDRNVPKYGMISSAAEPADSPHSIVRLKTPYAGWQPVFHDIEIPRHCPLDASRPCA